MAEVKTAVKKTPVKATAATTLQSSLPKDVFNVEVNNHELLQRAYQAYLANGRDNYAQVKTRGLVRGGGKKPWRQKGTGRARFGSSRNPIWRGGGIVFGPTGNENYTKTIPTAQKRKAVRQALTLANKAKKLHVIADFVVKDGKTKTAVALLEKNKVSRNTLLVVDQKSEELIRSTNNISNLKVITAKYLNVYDVLNADTILVTKKSVDIITEWLGDSTSSRQGGAK